MLEIEIKKTFESKGSCCFSYSVFISKM